MTDVQGTIYGLVDPRDDVIRYVGQTVKPIEARLAGHLAAPAPRVRAWIEELAVDGTTPRIVAIREAVPSADLDQVEREEILAHALRAELLNTAGNEPGNAKRRQASKEEAKRRRAEEAAVNLAWSQAAWRQVADQIRSATGGPISPAGIPIRPIPDCVWTWYLEYHAADQQLKASPPIGYILRQAGGVTVEGDTPEDQQRRDLLHRRELLRNSLHRYIRAYCVTFSNVDEGDRWGSGEGIFARADSAYEEAFESAEDMAQYLSLVPWAGRALDPWVALAERAGISSREAAFAEWVSSDVDVQRGVKLFQAAGASGYLGVRYQEWDTQIVDFTLAVGAAHVPNFVTPELLAGNLLEGLTKAAKDRQATNAMCQVLQRLDSAALDTVYGRDRLTEADRALDLPSGTSARVLEQVFGTGRSGTNDDAAKLLQRHSGAFDAPAVPTYSEWKGIHIPAMRALVASFCRAGLFAEAGGDAQAQMVEEARRTWHPSERSVRELDELEQALQGTRPSRAS
ncbi:hypothetical protein AB0C91_09905 [Streptomyces sp. NPDC048674]|uniref:hypothetical protein n=1 Tax=Streptomyces sp. NPDC048674 TaxID=3155491 RepID=UPI003418E210